MPLRRAYFLSAQATEDLEEGYPDPPDVGYQVVIVPDGRTPDWADAAVLGVVDEAALTVSPGPAGTRYTAYVRAFKGPRASSAAEISIAMVSDGGALYPRPNAPVIASVAPAAGGDVEVSWRHSDVNGAVRAASFRLFGDGGSGAVDWDTPLATVGATARRHVLTGLAPGARHLIGVEAFSAAGKGDGNRAAWDVVPRGAPPPGLDELAAVQTA